MKKTVKSFIALMMAVVLMLCTACGASHPVRELREESTGESETTQVIITESVDSSDSEYIEAIATTKQGDPDPTRTETTRPSDNTPTTRRESTTRGDITTMTKAPTTTKPAQNDWRAKAKQIVARELKKIDWASSVGARLIDLTQDGIPEIVIDYSEWEIWGINSIWIWNGTDYIENIPKREINMRTLGTFRNKQTGELALWNVNDADYIESHINAAEEFINRVEHGVEDCLYPEGETDFSVIRYEISNGKIKAVEVHKEVDKLIELAGGDRDPEPYLEQSKKLYKDFKNTYEPVTLYDSCVGFGYYNNSDKWTEYDYDSAVAVVDRY